MNIVNDFRSYLFSQTKPTGSLTIKNYLADVRRFILWYEENYSTSFTPLAFTSAVLTNYKTSMLSNKGNSLPAVSSTKRYLSSLRKLSLFMVEKNLIQQNPFTSFDKKLPEEDPYSLKLFKNFLYTQSASKLTVKNYMNDIRLFFDWLEKVIVYQNRAQTSNLIDRIDNKILEEYKNRLYNEAKLSPISINRKLSALRRYIRWQEERKVIKPFIIERSAPETEIKSAFSQIQQPRDLPLNALQGLAEEKKQEKNTKYSSFAPLRLSQKSIQIINRSFDLLIFDPIAHGVESIQYGLWKNGKKVIFAPVITILENASYVPKAVTIKTIIPKQMNMIPPRTANPAAVLQKVAQYRIAKNPAAVRNFTKALYAPLEISTEQMHWAQKLWHSLRYKRPGWYRKYHSYPLVNYLHYAIMMIFMVIAGSALFQTLNDNAPQRRAVLAAQATAPPRTLTFQGRLLDKTNTPITADTSLRFALYNSPTATGSAKLWQERQGIKPNQNGYFTATLGNQVRLDQSVFTGNSNLYIGITVGDNQELSPRQQIPTTNYAANSQSVEGMKPITDSPNVAQNVLLAFDSAGNLTIGGTASHTFEATGGQLNMSGQALLLTTNPGSNGNVQIIPDGSGIIDVQKPLQNTSKYSIPGGIPGAVEVADILSVLATTSSQSALVVNQNGTGDIISGQRDGIDKFRVDNAGNSFISGNLIINGDTIDTNSNAFDVGGSTLKYLILGNGATSLSLGASSGITKINNSLTVDNTTTLNGPVNTFGLITANKGILVPSAQTLTLGGFTPGAIPFIDPNSQVVQNVANFSWNDSSRTLHVLGSLCVNSVSGGTCSTSPGDVTLRNLNTSGTADLAENYVSSETLEPGEVVAAEGLSNNMAIVKSTSPYQKQLIGIVSSNPGITLNSDAGTDFEHPNVYPLALQGRVPVKVSSINGPIQPGDDLTSSPIPGVAMIATASGQTIGKALEVYTNQDPNAVGKIMAFVNLSYRASSAILNGKGDLSVAAKPQNIQNKTNLNADTTASGSASQQVSTDSATLDLQLGSASQSSTIYNSIATGSATATTSAESVKTPTPTPTLPGALQTNAALPENFTMLPKSASQLTYVPNFKADVATFNQGLIALGPASLTDVAVSDSIVVNNNLKITSDSLDTIGTDLNIQPLRQGDVRFQGGLVAIDTQGNLTVNGDATFVQNVSVKGQLDTGIIAPIPNHDLSIKLQNKANNTGSSLVINNANGKRVVQINQAGDVTASGDGRFNTVASQGFTIIRGVEADASNTITVADGSGGKGIISAHQTERTIITPYVTTHSLIYVTATSNTGSALPYVARQTPEDPQGGTKGSFSVEIPVPVNRDISFNWWIVN